MDEKFLLLLRGGGGTDGGWLPKMQSSLNERGGVRERKKKQKEKEGVKNKKIKYK